MSSTPIPKEQHISLRTDTANVVNFPLEASSQRLCESYIRGCLGNKSSTTAVIISWKSASTMAAPISSSASSVTLSVASGSSARAFLDTRREKKPATWFAVKKSPLVKSLEPCASLAVIVARATDAGSAFLPVSSPRLNLSVKYDRCVAVNRVRREAPALNAQPMVKYCVPAPEMGALRIGSSVSPPWPSSWCWYSRAALSNSVSRSRTSWCFSQSRWRSSEECRRKVFAQPSSGQANKLVDFASTSFVTSSWRPSVELEVWRWVTTVNVLGWLLLIFRAGSFAVFPSAPGINFPGPMFYALQTRMPSVVYAMFERKLTPSIL